MGDLSVARSVDPRTLHFGPFGLGGAMPPEVAVKFQAELMDPLELPEHVSTEVRSQFNKLRALYRDGVFTYDNFTRADRDAYRVLEVALKVRFLDHYQSVVPVVVDGRDDRREVRSFHDVNALLRDRAGKIRLRGHPRFNGSLASLIQWARSERYFYGQHNRLRERASLWLRNELTHTETDITVMPPDAQRAVRHAFEMLCRLWESDPVRGRDYPGLVPRSPWVIGLGPREREATWFPLDEYHPVSGDDSDGRVWHVVLAAETAWDELGAWRPVNVELVGIPVDPLWGPGSWPELRDQVSRRSLHPWPTDRVDLLDRLFYIRVIDGTPDLPRTAEQVRNVPSAGEGERWLVVRADSPGWAQNHAREALSRAHPVQGPCWRCPAEGVLPLTRRETIDEFIRKVLPNVPGPRRRGPNA